MIKKEKKEAIPFITINTQLKNGKQKTNFVLNPKALEMFTSPELRSKKLAVVSVAGPQRTGKSFLANRLLKQMDGFAVGPSTNPCTKGIWIWSEPVKINEDTSMIIIDTEGLNSVQRDINVDVKIFALSVLLSSVFIYNSLGHIDQKALQNMSLVLNITNNICLRKDSKGEDQDISQFFPHFYWVLRDFSLDLNGKTQKEYLQKQLAFVNNDEKDPKNQIRSKIKKFFTFRRCECFVRPIVDEKKLAHIQQMKYEDLRIQFRQKLDSFLSNFFNNLPVKTITGKPITGQMFVGLTMQYLNAINQGGVPQILTSLERVISSQSRKVMQELQTKYQLTMSEFMKQGKMPMDQSQLQQHHKYCVGILVSKFDQRLKQLLNQTQYKQMRKDLDKIIQKQFSSKMRMNQQKSQIKCKQGWDKFIKSYKMVEIDKADEIPASLVIEKGKQFQKAMRKFLEQTKAPRKYTFFIDKVPSFLFDYFDRVVQKIKKAYSDQLTKLKVTAKQAYQQQDRVKKTMLEQDKLLLDRQRQIQQIIREKDLYKQKAQSIEVVHGAYQQSSNMATADLQRNLQSRKKKNVELKAQNTQLNESLTKHKAELAQKKVQIISLQRRIRQLERDGQPLQTQQMAGQIITTLSDVRQKLSEMDDYYKKRLDETNPEQKRIRQIQQLRTEKLQAIERANDNYKQKKQQLVRNKEQMKKEYEKTIQILNKRAQNIQLQNIQLKKQSFDFPGNQQKVKAFMNEKRKLQDALDLKQNNLNIQTNLNQQKDRKIIELENILNDLKDKFAVKTADNARLKSFKESMGFILKESLCYVQGKSNKLKHSVQPLDAEDFEIVKDVFAQLGYKPF